MIRFNVSSSCTNNRKASCKVQKKRVLAPINARKMGLVPFNNPYDGISADSYTIKSQIANGGKLTPIPQTKLEGVYGSDSVRTSVSQMQVDVAAVKSE